MTFEIYSSLLMQPGAFSILIAPGERAREVLLQSPHLRRCLTLYVCGNYSRLLPGLDRSPGEFQIRRAFTGFQLVSILKEAHHSVVWVEHDPTLYDDDGVPTRRIAQALKSAAAGSAVVLYAPESDPVLREMERQADRLIYLEGTEGDFSRGLFASHHAPRIRDQTTLEAF
jgi:hypothetical protein